MYRSLTALGGTKSHTVIILDVATIGKSLITNPPRTYFAMVTSVHGRQLPFNVPNMDAITFEHTATVLADPYRALEHCERFASDVTGSLLRCVHEGCPILI
jgi:hypothetical protein